jgi:hypothetical protein
VGLSFRATVAVAKNGPTLLLEQGQLVDELAIGRNSRVCVTGIYGISDLAIAMLPVRNVLGRRCPLFKQKLVVPSHPFLANPVWAVGCRICTLYAFGVSGLLNSPCAQEHICCLVKLFDMNGREQLCYLMLEGLGILLVVIIILDL